MINYPGAKSKLQEQGIHIKGNKILITYRPVKQRKCLPELVHMYHGNAQLAWTLELPWTRFL